MPKILIAEIELQFTTISNLSELHHGTSFDCHGLNNLYLSSQHEVTTLLHVETSFNSISFALFNTANA